MKVLVVGGGGREHALVQALKQSPRVTEVYALPGNGGIADLATCVPISATDIPAIVQYARDAAIDFAVVGPDDPLVLGAVDALEEAGVPTFGPSARAAHIEGSKAFSKDLMRRYGIPTAKYETFTELEPALAYLADHPLPVVIKADGLALGKGVIIAHDKETAEATVRGMLSGESFGEAGKTVVIEEFLTGPEVSILAFTDGQTVVPMVSSMDHKQIFTGDKGPNTGGMGVVAPNPFYTGEVAKFCKEHIFAPTVAAMRAEDRTFKGCLYFGLMVTPAGPKVIEYNCRFGDPEAQAVLPLLETDLLTVMEAVREGRLDQVDVEFRPEASCCVVLASAGYPQAAQTGEELAVGPLGEDVQVFHAGTKREGEGLVTAGGRVLAVTTCAPTLEEAVAKTYAALPNITFPGAQWRTDIGARALQAEGNNSN